MPAFVVAMACDTESEPPANEAAAEASPDDAAAPAQPARSFAKPAEESPGVEVSEAMKTFMAELGEHDQVAAALKKYGAEGLETDIGIYNIEEPVVVASTEGNADGETCYAMEAKTGAVRRKFELCWNGGKITRANDEGLQL